jgi:hypothetical protein
MSDSDRKFLRKFQPPIGKYGSCDVAEIFDDTLFYASLLKEVLGHAGTADVRSMQKTRTASAFRAAKGRRLSAKVIEKLVGFMAPCPQEEQTEETADVLVRSLFQ